MKQKIEKLMVKPGTCRRGPNKGASLMVRLPHTMGGMMMSPEGMLVPNDSYWARRLKGGDVVLFESSKGVAVPFKTPKKGKE